MLLVSNPILKSLETWAPQQTWVHLRSLTQHPQHKVQIVQHSSWTLLVSNPIRSHPNLSSSKKRVHATSLTQHSPNRVQTVLSHVGHALFRLPFQNISINVWNICKDAWLVKAGFQRVLRHVEKTSMMGVWQCPIRTFVDFCLSLGL